MLHFILGGCFGCTSEETAVHNLDTLQQVCMDADHLLHLALHHPHTLTDQHIDQSVITISTRLERALCNPNSF